MSQTLLNYQQVLEQLQASANKIADVTELLENQSELVLNHNEDQNAHAYIQQRINEISTLNPVTVSTAIGNHNTAVNSHADLRSQIINLEQTVNNIGGSGAITNTVNSGITTHNQSNSAHADIRALISNMASSSSITNTINDALAGHDANANAHPLLSNQINALASTVAGHSTEIQNMNMTLSVLESILNSGGGGSVGTIPMTGFTHGLPTIVKPNSTHTINFAGVTPPATGTLSFSINAGDSGLTFSKTTNIAAGENVTVTVPAGAVRGSVKTFAVTAAYSDSGDTGTKTIPFAINRLPDVNSTSLSLPSIVKPNSTHATAIVDGSDADGQQVTFNITCDRAYVTFSKSTGLVAGESFNVIYSSSAVRGETPTFTITANDGLETASRTLSTGKVNTLPNSSAILANGLQTTVVGGTAYSFNLSGGTDVDGQTVTYKITGADGLNMTPVENISAGSNIVFTPTKVPSASNISFTVYAVDSLGEQSSTGKSFVVTVNPILRIATPTILSPTNGQSINMPYTFQISAYSVEPEM